MNDKIRQEAMHLHNWCEGQCDCAHCDFGRDNRTCKISGIPAQWFDEDDHSADTGKTMKTRQERFLEMFPRAKKALNGILKFCPQEVDSSFMCLLILRNGTACEDCRREYWLAEEDEKNG